MDVTPAEYDSTNDCVSAKRARRSNAKLPNGSERNGCGPNGYDPSKGKAHKRSRLRPACGPDTTYTGSGSLVAPRLLIFAA